MTVYAVYNSQGVVGRCDAKCHNAQHSKCECICGGMNHGKGLGQAMANVQDLFVRTLKEGKNVPSYMEEYATVITRPRKDASYQKELF